MDKFAPPRKGLRALGIRGAGASAWRMAAAMKKLSRRDDDLKG
jgi:hypothetical protein